MTKEELHNELSEYAYTNEVTIIGINDVVDFIWYKLQDRERIIEELQKQLQIHE